MAKESVSKAYEKINERIFALLEQGVVPWHKPWKAGNAGMPANLSSKKPYRGINVFLLNVSGFNSRYWLTYKQATEKGGQVRKGEHGYPVIFWKWNDKEEKNEETGRLERKRFPLLRYYTVFNLEQIDGIEDPDGVKDEELIEFKPIEAAEKVVADMPSKPKVKHQVNRACYFPVYDEVHMPKPERFDSEEFYYQTLFHEITHATGHESRLNRRNSTEARNFGDSKYSQEELVAEMGAAFLCGHCGIEQATLENSASYIASWLQVLKNNKKMLVNAAAQAQKAADFILALDETPPAAEEE
jgi:antirestriction protein ArdC